MDKERRSRLKSVVGQARRIVEDDVRVQLRRLGIDENELKPVQNLLHLSVEDKELRTRIIEVIEKEKAGDISYGEAFDRYVRHVGFTYVNRIAALRAMEVRSLIKETVIRRADYGGHSKREYELAERERISDAYELLKTGLVEAFNEVSAEIRVLFDVNSEYSLVFPGHKAFLELIGLLSEEVPEGDWKEDEVIGWIYQYYNEEARREYRRARRKPVPDDIPVINQFYTPDWIVRTLVDNTLARLWLEMHVGSELREFCTYFVPSNNMQRERQVKKVQEIKVIDPACGSGHFLVYAFDVLYHMYREQEPDVPPSEIPRLILENNLFGADIDLYSVQLAALSLFLKAKTYDSSLKIGKLNIICADIRIANGNLASEFLRRFSDDPDLQRIFAKLLEDLSDTFAIGSLLKVRQPFERFFADRKGRGKQARFTSVISGQTELGKKGLIGQGKLAVQTSEETDNLLIVPKERTIEDMLKELRKFEREAIEAHDMGRLLFATETEKSVGLLTVLSEKYDVVLLNPPYGEMPVRTKEYLRKHYPKTHIDYYAAFIEQAIDLALYEGYVGAITGRTFMFLSSYQWLRQVLFRETAQPQIILDLGFGVLDVAMARWAAFTAQKKFSKAPQNTIFLRLTEGVGELEKKTAWEKAVGALRAGKTHSLVYDKSLEEFSQIPGMPYSYFALSNLLSLFTKFPPFDRDLVNAKNAFKVADIKYGLCTYDDARFLRYFWEVQPEFQGKQRKWVPFAKGNDAFYSDIVLLVNWEKNGEEIRTFVGGK
jgi:hypothetical protein